MPLAHYYDVDLEHSAKYTSSHRLLKNREAAEWYRNALVQHEQVASKKNNLYELTRAVYVIDTRHLCYDELNTMPLGWHCDENQLNTFSIDLFSTAASFTIARSRLWCWIV